MLFQFQGATEGELYGKMIMKGGTSNVAIQWFGVPAWYS